MSGVLAPAAPGPPLLSVRDLRTSFRTDAGSARAVDGVSFSVRAGETVCIVGESGCGKTATALSLLRLLPPTATIEPGSAVEFEGRDLMTLDASGWRAVRGARIGIVFQDAMTALDPVIRVGDQVAEVARVHTPGIPRGAARARAVELLALTGIAGPEDRAHQYPYELSGGTRQRVMLAIALAMHPALLIADEPTTALDVTVQAQILSLVADLQRRLGMAILLITHDLRVAAALADRVIVMYAGEIVESAPAALFFAEPQHPYAAGLLRAVPHSEPPRRPSGRDPGRRPIRDRLAPRLPLPRAVRLRVVALRERAPAAVRGLRGARVALPPRPGAEPARRRPRRTAVTGATAPPLLAVDRLTKHYALTRGPFGRPVGVIRAIDAVSFRVARGETLGLVGESGSGKTTLALAILRLTEPTAGRIRFDGIEVGALGPAPLRRLRRRMQIIFQDPAGVLDPRLPIDVSVGEGLAIHRLAEGAAAAARVRALLDEVGLPAAIARRYPHECSGGQRQRVGIARALALEPDFVVCDEPVSALDVSTQAQVINLLCDLQRSHGLTYLFIAHDLGLIAHVATRVGVMYFGKLVEIGTTADVFRDPIMPYTQALLASVPRLDPAARAARAPLGGEPPAPAQLPTGCVLHPRCPHPAKDAECTRVDPPLEEKAPGHWAACLKEPIRRARPVPPTA